MRRRGGQAAQMIVIVGLLAFPPAADAVREWKSVKDQPGGGVNIANTNEIGLERDSDDVLHMLWVNGRTDGTQALLHTAVSGPDSYNNLDVAKPELVMSVSPAAGQSFNDRVDLIGAPGGGLRALFSTTFPASPYDGIVATSTSADGGATWSAAEAASATAVAQRSPVYAAAGISGGLGLDGTVYSTWGDSSPDGGGYHVGLATNVADREFSPACCEIDPNVGVDSVTGDVFVAANLADDGIQVMSADGGTSATAPQSAHAWTLQRTSITGRIGAPGVYVGYGAGENMFSARPAIWRVGDPTGIVLKNQHDAANVGITPAPDGRLWIYWEREGVVYASRTNPSVTKFGRIVQRNAPKPENSIYRLAGEGSSGQLDLFALDGPANGSPRWWVRPLLPGVTMKALGNGKVAPGHKIKFLLTDAGDPIGGADVYSFIDGIEVDAETNDDGIAKLRVPKAARPAKERAFGGTSGYEWGEASFKITN